MNRVLCVLIFAGCLSGQTSEIQTRESITSTLSSLRTAKIAPAAQTAKLVEQLRAMREGLNPSDVALTDFSRELVSNLSPQNVLKASAARMAEQIVTVFQSGGIATYRYNDALSAFETELTDAGVKDAAAHSLARRLKLFGDQIRGPQDMRLVAGSK